MTTAVIGGHELGLLDGFLSLLNRKNRNDRTSNGTPGHGEQAYANVSNAEPPSVPQALRCSTNEPRPD